MNLNVFKLFSFQSFIVNLISLNSAQARDMQSTSTRWSLSPQRRTSLRSMPWNAWMPSQLSQWESVSLKSDFIINVFIKILDLPTVLVDLLMHMHVDSMGNRLLGLQGNTSTSSSSWKPCAWSQCCKSTLNQSFNVFYISSVSFCSICLIFYKCILSTYFNKMLGPEFLLTCCGFHNSCCECFVPILDEMSWEM